VGPCLLGVDEKEVGKCEDRCEVFWLGGLGAGFVGGLRSRAMMEGLRVVDALQVENVSILDFVRSFRGRKMDRRAEGGLTDPYSSPASQHLSPFSKRRNNAWPD
jgi:hypothetical protein